MTALKKMMPGLFAAAVVGGSPAFAQNADTQTHLLIVSGLSGEERFAKSFEEWSSSIVTAAKQSGVPAANISWLAETAGAGAAQRSTKENVERAVRSVVARAGAQDRVLIILFGHGSYQGGESRINLPGPDINAAELAALLTPLQTQRVAVVNTTSASGGFVQALAAPNRLVITATKSGMESNETVFGGYFAAALSGDGADVDKDGRVSLLEAFDFARQEVAREYQRANKLLTEHAIIDAIGDGKGVAAAEPEDAHGRSARMFYVSGRAVAAAAAAATPQLRALHDEKARIETALDELRARKADMPAAAYDAALEKLLVDLSLNAQAIRRLEGGAP